MERIRFPLEFRAFFLRGTVECSVVSEFKNQSVWEFGGMFGLGIFQAPAALWGLILCLIPVLIFHFFRRPPAVVPWGAFRFLREAQEKIQTRTRFWEIFGILVRTLAIFCLILALASPVLVSDPDSGSGMRPVSSRDSSSRAVSFSSERFGVLVVDPSASMGALTGAAEVADPEVSRLDQALHACQKRLEFWENQEDPVRVYVLPVNFSENFKISELQKMDPSVVLSRIFSEKKVADWEKTLWTLDEMLREDRGQCVEVAVFSDFTDETAALRKFLDGVEKLLPEARLQMVSVVSEAPDLALRTLSLDSVPILKKQETSISAEVQSFGIPKNVSVCVELTLWAKRKNGLEKSFRTEKWLTIPPDSVKDLEFEVKFPETGEFLVEAALKNAVSNELPLTDSFSANDVLRRAVRVKACANFLIAETWNTDSGTDNGSGTAYLKSALESIGTARYSDSAEPPFRIDCRKDPDFRSLDPGAYDAVFLCGISLFTPEEAVALERAVENGTAVWVFCGPKVTEDSFLPLSSILPAFASGKEQILPSGGALRLTLPDAVHEVSEIFLENSDSGLSETPIFRWTPLVSVEGIGRKLDRNGEPDSGENTEANAVQDVEMGGGHGIFGIANELGRISVPLKLTNGSPFLMVRELPCARTAICAVSADAAGTPLPHLPVWVPLVERTLHFLLSAPIPLPPQTIPNCPRSESVRLNMPIAPAEIPENWEFTSCEAFLEASATADPSNPAVSILWLLALIFLAASIGAGRGWK